MNVVRSSNENEPSVQVPSAGCIERWAFDYVTSTALSHKLAPPDVPERFAAERARPVRISRPGRPAELEVTWEKYKAPKTAGALRDTKKRAQLLHTFLHHELQAAELMCWAVLAFPEMPEAFRRGLIGICQDEIRHMRMYSAHIRELGFSVGSFPVRDWFWQRTPQASTALSFLAVMGLGFEAANLDHTQRYAVMFREAGDERGARMQEVVGEEEVRHVAFGAHWFRELSSNLTFADWERALPEPLSPMVMRGAPVSRELRLRAGLPQSFVDELEAWRPVSRGC